MMPFLIRDLDIIARSKHLETWRALKRFEYNSDFARIAKIFTVLNTRSFRTVYLDKIREIKGKDSKMRFYLEEFPKEKITPRVQTKRRPYYSDKIFDPKHLLTKSSTTVRNNEDLTKLLIRAYESEILPKEEKNAIDIETIRKELSKRSQTNRQGVIILDVNEELENQRKQYRGVKLKALLQFGLQYDEMTRKNLKAIGKDEKQIEKIIAA